MFRPTSKLFCAAAVTVTSVAVAACGGSSSPQSTVASNQQHQFLTGAALRQFDADAVRFSSCMRSHGAPSYPDVRNPAEFKESMAPSTPGTQAPSFKSAQAACAHLIPQQTAVGADQTTHAEKDALIAFAGCMRRHGLTRFPDPTSTGQLTHQMLASAGINVQQPAVVRTADSCTSVTHGLLTKTDVARFVAEQ